MTNNTLRRALDTYGAEKQTMMMFEEMAELQKALCKNLRGQDNRENVAEELADVKIMMAQMMMLHNCADLVDEYVAIKLDRLNKRLEALNEKADR